MLEALRALLTRVFGVDFSPPEAPAGDVPQVFRAAEGFRSYLRWAFVLRTAALWCFGALPLVGLCVGAGMSGAPTWAVLLGLCAVTAGASTATFFGYAAMQLDYELRWYILTDRALRIREGVFFLREVTLTLANVQDIKVSQGPLQQLFGIHDLIVDTAGGGAHAAASGSVQGHRGLLRGIDAGRGLKDILAARVKQRRGAGLGDLDEHLAAPTQADDVIGALREVQAAAHALRAAAEHTARTPSQ